MIYRFIVISDEVDDFMREIQIDSDATFFELHKAILDSCEYEDKELTSFTICENGWEKGQEVTREEMDVDSSVDSYVMDNTRLSELLEDEKQHLLFTFDPVANRAFFMELAQIITKKTLKEPKVTRSLGKAPEQSIDFDELLKNDPIITSSDDDDLYGSDIDESEEEFSDYSISEGNPYED